MEIYVLEMVSEPNTNGKTYAIPSTHQRLVPAEY